MGLPVEPVPIVILTGAGLSKESGLDTFRDKDGIWSKVRLEDVATPDAFRRDPDRVHEFYNMRRAGLRNPDVHPNAAHLALAELERHWPEEVLVVTQNIDDLHERAGSQNLLHMHGELFKIRCLNCGTVHVWREDLGVGHYCSSCGQARGLRPDIVWFGEMPVGMDRIADALGTCGLFISIGTSGNVYPAAGFVAEVRRAGLAYSVELNLEPSSGASLFHECRHGMATEVVPAFVSELVACLD